MKITMHSVPPVQAFTAAAAAVFAFGFATAGDARARHRPFEGRPAQHSRP